MSVLLHEIITPPTPPEPSIYEALIDLVEQAEYADEHGHPVEALILLGTARSRLVSYLHGAAN